MKAVLRGIVSMAFSTIEDQKTQQRVPPKVKNVPTLSRPTITPPSPVPADEVYKPLSSSDPIPFGAVTKVKSTTDNYGASTIKYIRYLINPDRGKRNGHDARNGKLSP